MNILNTSKHIITNQDTSVYTTVHSMSNLDTKRHKLAFFDRKIHIINTKCAGVRIWAPNPNP